MLRWAYGYWDLNTCMLCYVGKMCYFRSLWLLQKQGYGYFQDVSSKYGPLSLISVQFWYTYSSQVFSCIVHRNFQWISENNSNSSMTTSKKNLPCPECSQMVKKMNVFKRVVFIHALVLYHHQLHVNHWLNIYSLYDTVFPLIFAAP